MTMRALACDIAVCQKLFSLLIVILLGSLLYQFTLIVEFAEEVSSKLMMDVGCRATIDIE